MAVAEQISQNCACGKRLKAPANAVGKRARCPACGNVVTLAAAPAATARVAQKQVPVVPITYAPPPLPEPASAPEPAKEEDDYGALYDFAEQEPVVAPTAPAIVACPQCHTVMNAGAVICTTCGYDTRTGRSLSTAAAATPAKTPAKTLAYASPGRKPAKPVDYMAPQGSLVLGIILSAVFALGASIVWIIVALITGFSFALIAILIGFAAGVGMQIGQKGYSRAGGIIAASMTLFAIIVAKLAVFVLVVAVGGHLSSLYFFSPIGIIIIVVGVGAAFRTANGAVSSS